MTILITALVTVLVVANGLLAYLLRKQQRHIDHLYGQVAKLAVNQEHINNNHEKLMAAEETAEQRIAEKIEKKWDKGLENMMSYNPFIRQEASDDV